MREYVLKTIREPSNIIRNRTEVSLRSWYPAISLTSFLDREVLGISFCLRDSLNFLNSSAEGWSFFRNSRTPSSLRLEHQEENEMALWIGDPSFGDPSCCSLCTRFIKFLIA